MKAGCTGIVALGSLGEGGTLSLRGEGRGPAGGPRGPWPAGRPSWRASPPSARRSASPWRKSAEAAGCAGLMVLPPYVYKGDWRETKAHFRAVIAATAPALHALQQPDRLRAPTSCPSSSRSCAATFPTSWRSRSRARTSGGVTALRARLDGRLALLVGVDDLIVEGVAAGAVGWIAGLVNALPEESVRLFDLARAGPPRRGAGALRVVPAPPAPRRGAQVRPAHQARAGGGGPGQRDGASAAALPSWATSAMRRSPSSGAPCAGGRRPEGGGVAAGPVFDTRR